MVLLLVAITSLESEVFSTRGAKSSKVLHNVVITLTGIPTPGGALVGIGKDVIKSVAIWILLATPPMVVLVLFNVFKIDLVAIIVALIEEITVTVICSCYTFL